MSDATPPPEVSSTGGDGGRVERISADSAGETFGEAFRSAVRNAGIGQVAPGEVPSGAAMLRVVGGVRGLIEAILPGLGFLVVFAFSKQLIPSVIAPVALSLIFVVIRLATKTPVTQALAGVFGVLLSAGLALWTGRAEDNFVYGLIVNVVSLGVVLISLLARWPLVGLIVGVLTNEFTQWRKSRAKRKVLVLTTWLWAGLFGVRLLVEAPLYFAGHTEVLAAMRLLLGVPLYAGMLWITWLLVSSVYRKVGESSTVTPSE